MKLTLAFTLVAFILDSTRQQVAGQTNDSSLVLLQVVYRHGDRTPIRTFKNDPIPITAWKEGPGQLTKVGCLQHYTLGSHLRSRYANFLTGNPHELRVWSSDKDRCLASAQCHLAGFAVPSADWAWNQTFHWQPVAIHTRPTFEDGMLVPGDAYCPEAAAEEERVKNSPEGQAFLKKYQKLYKTLTEKTGSIIADWYDAAYVYDVLLIEQYHNYTIPEWAKGLWKDLKYQSDQSFVFRTKTPLLKRLRAGLLAANMSGNLEAAAKNMSHYKVFMYSTHDTEISAILDALGVFDDHAPPYCSSLVLELWKNGPGNFSVRGLALNAFDLEPRPFHFPGCGGEFCTLEDFLSLAKVYIPDDWQRDCGLRQPFFLSDGALALVIGQSAILAIVVFSCTAYCLLRRRKTPKNVVAYSPLPTEFTTTN
uniref:Putative lysosomal & prostatic acid phosphatase n=1 Tax=Rhipicephalus pulchellus TaxID=72859 RepID=L7M8T7_RHIPC